MRETWIFVDRQHGERGLYTLTKTEATIRGSRKLIKQKKFQLARRLPFAAIPTLIAGARHLDRR